MESFTNIVLNTEVFNSQKFAEREADFNIAFGIDANFARGMGILIDAISINNKQAKIVFHIFTDSIKESDQNKLKQLVKYDWIMLKFYFIDNKAFEKLPTTLAWSYATYYRFIMGKILHGTVDKILYLDADILCIGSLNELMNIDMAENVVLAISEQGKINVERLSIQQGKYFNAGVLYIDINKWNENKISEQAIELIKADTGKFTYLDQDVLNVLLDGKTKFIAEKWNYLYDMRKMNNKLPDSVVLVHFIGDKPWQRWAEHHFMVKLYEKYANKTPWRDVPLIEPSHYKDKKRMAKSYRIRKQYKNAVVWYIKYMATKLQHKYQ